MTDSTSFQEKKGFISSSLLAFVLSVLGMAILLVIAFLSAWRGQTVTAFTLFALFLCCPPLISFEISRPSARELSAIAVMTALSVFGRVAFSPFPGFKPVSAVVILTGLAFGPGAGFVCGASSALLSNLFFGQGPWTPYQMLAWGLIGLLAGMFRRVRGKKLVPVLVLLGIVGGILFSALTDVWTTVSAASSFLLPAYFTCLVAALPFTGIYIVSNILFLFALSHPILKKADRIKKKYGLFDCNVKKAEIRKNIDL